MDAKESCQTAARPKPLGFKKVSLLRPLFRAGAPSRWLSKEQPITSELNVGKIPLAQRTRLRKAEQVVRLGANDADFRRNPMHSIARES